MAGATGLEPAASGVTGRLFLNDFNARFNSWRQNRGAKALRFDYGRAKVESQTRPPRSGAMRFGRSIVATPRGR